MRNEAHASISATELVRNLAGVIDRVRMSSNKADFRKIPGLKVASLS